MNELITYFLIALIFSIISFFIGKLLSKLNFEKEKTLIEKEKSTLEERASLLQQSKDMVENNYIELQKELKNNQQEKEHLISINTRQDSENINLQLKLDEHKTEVEELQEKFTKEFENLANKILEEKSNKFTAQNKENLKIILNPLQEKIKIFEDKVDKTHKESIDYHAALRQQILGLKELNQQMSKETLNLTKALKGDNKMQGNWGELVLERVLEKSGLEKDREYFVQQSFMNDDGKRVLPDVVIHLPDNKKMIVDSKVSLTAYEQFVNEDDDTSKAQFLKEHIASLKRHIEQLSEKKYEDIYQIESPDFVLLFIPIEPAFAVAINSDNHLYNKAFEKNIVIVTPSTLLATLRTIDSMWNNEKQQKNAIEIARQAGALYDKFQGLLSDLITIGKRIDDSKKEYSNAMNKLVDGRGNLITSIEKLKKMGAKAKKSIPENIIERASQDD
ncbi:MAG: DNA recombination protein RmuC [Polaribacter sp.]|uniref:DNA recombination protein RmuC n=1 Tax=Polaribacter sp. TaxID=1920175 RepID=UPI0026340E71|nr:DNA recombination protein RmuC [Polaribacter sp.]MBT4413725.1 DNA recombination protein RmuC [Polaribacter sp.]MDG1195777.1 DNA recombination protein RmuC [Polaribacter sp.]MDG1404463.1 DNA recombination protein RmuC [Polaribacter sp.]MDG2437644.1 DNA recombination protein RmuC [Polaribacter sp.]